MHKIYTKAKDTAIIVAQNIQFSNTHEVLKVYP